MYMRHPPWGATVNRTMIASTPVRGLACVGLLAAALVAGSPTGAYSQPAPSSERIAGTDGVVIANLAVPPELVPPAGQKPLADFAASGVQVYQCTNGAWVFVEPAASLIGRAKGQRGVQTAVHFRGPSWESTTDGSLVEARAIASSPVSGSIPQLLLQSTRNRGDGLFGHVTYIQRLATSGGAIPTGSCTDGQTSGVAYRAQYRFFTPAA
jgi:hypothetical protein